MSTEDRPSDQSRELFRLIVENVRDYAIYMVDLTGTIISWNPGVERMFGFTEEEFLAWEPGRRFAFTVTHARWPGLKAMVEDVRLEPDGTDATTVTVRPPCSG